jgi:ABC-2 type transport system permease protein
MKNVWLVARREFMTRAKGRGFVPGILISAVLIIAVVYLPTIIGLLSDSKPLAVAVVNQSGATRFAGQDLNVYLESALNTNPNGQTSQRKAFNLSYPPESELNSVRESVRQEKTGGLLVLKRNAGGELTFEYFTTKRPSDVTTLRIRDAATNLAISDRLARAGLSDGGQTARIFAPATIDVTSVTEARERERGLSGNEATTVYILTFMLVATLFGSIIGYGQMIAQGVAEEKGNRSMEIVLTAIAPVQMMFGKLLGIGAVGLVSFVGTLALAVPAFLAQGAVNSWLGLEGSQNGLNLASITGGLVAYFGLFYILGYFVYAAIYAAAGSLCSRADEVTQMVGTLSYLPMIGFLVTSFALSAIEASWVVALSYVPFFSPMLMFARLAQGTVAPYEIAIAVGLLLVTIGVLTWLAARIYRVGVLLYGKRPNLWQLLTN